MLQSLLVPLFYLMVPNQFSVISSSIPSSGGLSVILFIISLVNLADEAIDDLPL